MIVWAPPFLTDFDNELAHARRRIAENSVPPEHEVSNVMLTAKQGVTDTGMF